MKGSASNVFGLFQKKPVRSEQEKTMMNNSSKEMKKPYVNAIDNSNSKEVCISEVMDEVTTFFEPQYAPENGEVQQHVTDSAEAVEKSPVFGYCLTDYMQQDVKPKIFAAKSQRGYFPQNVRKINQDVYYALEGASIVLPLEYYYSKISKTYVEQNRSGSVPVSANWFCIMDGHGSYGHDVAHLMKEIFSVLFEQEKKANLKKLLGYNKMLKNLSCAKINSSADSGGSTSNPSDNPFKNIKIVNDIKANISPKKFFQRKTSVTNHCNVIHDSQITTAMKQEAMRLRTEDVESSIHRIFQKAEKMLDSSKIDISYSGCTCSGVLLFENQVFSVNIGDSRGVIGFSHSNNQDVPFSCPVYTMNRSKFSSSHLTSPNTDNGTSLSTDNAASPNTDNETRESTDNGASPNTENGASQNTENGANLSTENLASPNTDNETRASTDESLYPLLNRTKGSHISSSECNTAANTISQEINSNIGSIDKEADLNYTWKALQISDDHKPDRPDERSRILRNNGAVSQYVTEFGAPIGPPRVWIRGQYVPGLAMSRSFGDKVAASAGVICVPEITLHLVQASRNFIVLASDGVWEFVSNKRAIEIIAPYYETSNPASACEAIVDYATTCWIANEEVIDDISCLIIFF